MLKQIKNLRNNLNNYFKQTIFKSQSIMFPLTQKVVNYKNQQFQLFLNQRSIHQKVCQLATEINSFYKELLKNNQEEDVFTICILKGGILFFTDLVKKLKFLARPQFLYDKKVNKFLKGQETIHIKDMNNKHVLVIMNFIDKIDTISSIYELMSKLGAKSINFAVLISNVSGQQIKVACKWIGFSYQFPIQLIGYGFDKDQYFRPLNQIYHKVQNQLEQQTDQNPEVV